MFADAADPDLPGVRERADLEDRRRPSPSSWTSSGRAGGPAAGGRARRVTGCSACARRCALVHRPQSRSAGPRRAQDRLRYDEAFAAADRAGPAASGARGALPATPRTAPADGRARRASTRGCRSSSPTVRSRSAARSRRPGRCATPCTGCCRARSGRARPSSPCGRCSPVVDAGGQAALLAPTEVLAAAAPPLDHRDARRRWPSAAMLGGADIGTRVALLTGSHDRGGAPAGAARRRRAATPASSSAPTRCSRTRCSSSTSAWSSSTSSTGSASSSATRCAPRPTRRRRTCWS